MAAARLPDSTYAVLGLIDKIPGSSGYDLVGVAGRSLAHFWPVSQTLLYRELDRLTELGWVTATRVTQTRVPSKWIYHGTERGRRALTDWLATPVANGGGFRSPVLLRFFFAYRMPPDELRALLAGYRSVLQAQHDELQAIMDMLASVTTREARSGRLTALHGVLTAAAGLHWVDEVQAQLSLDDPR